jgi:acetolactate synthase-1/2/3 large subunit
MWAAQSLEVNTEQLFMTSGGMGAMGFALPAAIGSSLALNKKPVVVIAGDGAFQMNIQELQTIVRNKLPIKIVVINNQALGMIRQFQDSYFEGRYQSTYWGYSAPDFAAIATAYGIPAKTISTPEEITQGCQWLWNKPDECALLQVMIDPHTNTYPKIAFGKPLTEMEPFSKPIAMEGT